MARGSSAPLTRTRRFGKCEAKWASGPMPRRMRSKTGRPALLKEMACRAGGGGVGGREGWWVGGAGFASGVKHTGGRETAAGEGVAAIRAFAVCVRSESISTF